MICTGEVNERQLDELSELVTSQESFKKRKQQLALKHLEDEFRDETRSMEFRSSFSNKQNQELRRISVY